MHQFSRQTATRLFATTLLVLSGGCAAFTPSQRGAETRREWFDNLRAATGHGDHLGLSAESREIEDNLNSRFGG